MAASASSTQGNPFSGAQVVNKPKPAPAASAFSGCRVTNQVAAAEQSQHRPAVSISSRLSVATTESDGSVASDDDNKDEMSSSRSASPSELLDVAEGSFECTGNTQQARQFIQDQIGSFLSEKVAHCLMNQILPSDSMRVVLRKRATGNLEFAIEYLDSRTTKFKIETVMGLKPKFSLQINGTVKGYICPKGKYITFTEGVSLTHAQKPLNLVQKGILAAVKKHLPRNLLGCVEQWKKDNDNGVLTVALSGLTFMAQDENVAVECEIAASYHGSETVYDRTLFSMLSDEMLALFKRVDWDQTDVASE
jgi:hypothetical protein